MKLKSSMSSVILISVILSVNACNNATTEKAKNMADSAATTADSALQQVKQDARSVAAKVESAINGNPDSNFVVKAAMDNSMEIRLLQAGIDNGTDKELKAHAKMMLADHKKLGTGVKAYASKKGYTLMDGDNGKADNELATLNSKTKGTDWDKEWVSALKDGHNNAIDLFEKAKDNVRDPELKNMITDALPTLHTHLDMMVKLQDKMNR